MALRLQPRSRMRMILTTVALLGLLICGAASTASAQISVGIRIGAPPAPRAYRVPRAPGPDYVWVEGYWYPQNGHYRWLNGYWTRPPYEGAYWVAPYYVNGQYYEGHWEGPRGIVRHDHRWDRDPRHDEGRAPARDDNRRRDDDRRRDNDRGDRH